ncbi:MAG: putative rane protein [Marmoricola sp.]|nr:putative rane protein [Marmoricola sp.]
MTSCGHEHEDGAYILGALSPEDRIAFERHLPGCPTCAQSVGDLAGLPGLLARVPAGILDAEELPLPVPDTLLPGLVRRAAAERRRRRWVTGGLVAAALAGAIAVGAAGTAVITHHDSSPSAGVATAKAQRLEPIGTQPISGWVSLTPVAWGTRLDLICSYAGDKSAYDQAGTTYTMYVTHADGSTEQVASWKALPGRTTHVTGGTAASTSDITGVQIRSANGRTVLRLS